ncbi:hypothetical protein JFU37_24630 [Pseudomonas sp. TH41]|uniref:hypothetical protein n=1 Tax=Pseudomonas sp. TH41 TaxID=2796405 RepID=UPI001913E81B|nr:hypothetical protein [Pseudomonas sp. TH41]MBK5355676.1 hypothetical protein [Pseudomonas sp. TH41]
MSIGTVSASNSVTINGQSPAQRDSSVKGNQATAPTTATAASNVKVALKEATETAAQTTQEAQHGDRQAQRLMQKQHHASTAAPTSGVVNGNGQITGEIINTKA